jgi:hypothetical protein
MSVPSAPRLPATQTRAFPRWLLPVVLLAGAVAFFPTLAGGFLGDDFVYIARFRELPWSEWPGLFIRDWSGGVWGSQLHELRPFAALSFMTDAKLFGGWAPGYQLTNLLLHLLATFLVTRLAWRYTVHSVAGTLVAGLVFALHPAHAEAVIWVTGRVDLLATTAALLFWVGAEQYSDHGRRSCLVITLAAFFLGMFSKELCMFAPLLLLLRWLLLDLRAPRTVWFRRARMLAGVLVIFAVYATARRLAFGHDGIGYNLWADNPAWNRQAAHFGWLLPILPFLGRAEWATNPSLTTLHAVWLALAGLTLGGLVFAVWRQARLPAAVLFFGGVWYFVTVFPLTGVVYFSPRHLYFPTVGFALAAGLVVALWRAPALRMLLGTAFVAWCGLALLPAIRPWQASAKASREAMAALDRALLSAPPDALALTAVPETLGPVWLWAWSSPQCYGAPFLSRPRPATRIVERQVNSTRSDTWAADRKPVETLRSGASAVALFVSDSGEVFCRPVSAAQLQTAATQLAAAGVSNETWTACVKALAQP